MTRFRHLVEIGAGDRWSSEGLAWALKGDAELVTLYEPNTILCADLKRAAEGLGNVVVHEAAVTSAFRDLYHMGYASYLRGAPSFLSTSVEEGGEKWWEPLAREVTCVKVDRIDHGTIDALVLTCSGSEMDVLTHLVSRPRSIWTKAYLHNAKHGEYWSGVYAWLKGERYRGRLLQGNQHGTFQSVCWERG